LRALITGVNGFIGSFLAEHLLELGWEVRGLVRKTSNLRWIEHLPLELVYGALTDENSLEAAVQDVDVIFHLAGLTKARRPEDYFAVNEGGTANLLRAWSRWGSPLRRFVLVSSQAAAGPSRGRMPRREEDEPQPLTSYGLSKLRAEQVARQYADQLPLTIVRPPAVYGPRDRDMLVFFRYIASGIKPLLGRGERLVSVVYVRELVRALSLAATREEAVGQTYFIAYPEPVEWGAFADLIARVMGKRAKRVVLPTWVLGPAAWISEFGAFLRGRAATLNREKVREIRERYWVLSVEKARRELGFEPETSVEQSVRQTVEWYRQQGWL